MKISRTANEVEFRFLTDNSASDMAPNRFLNRLQQQLFVYEEKEANGVDNFEAATALSAKVDKSVTNYANNALKFVLKETDLLDYFRERLVSLQKYLNTEKWDYKAFFISKKTCTANYLYGELSYRDDMFLLLFNSKLYNQAKGTSSHVENSCFYFDEVSKTYYLTVNIRISFGSSFWARTKTTKSYFCFVLFSSHSACTRQTIFRRLISALKSKYSAMTRPQKEIR